MAEFVIDGLLNERFTLTARKATGTAFVTLSFNIRMERLTPTKLLRSPKGRRDSFIQLQLRLRSFEPLASLASGKTGTLIVLGLALVMLVVMLQRSFESYSFSLSKWTSIEPQVDLFSTRSTDHEAPQVCTAFYGFLLGRFKG